MTLDPPSLAAAVSPAIRSRLAGRNIALICTGANISPAQLRLVVEGMHTVR